MYNVNYRTGLEEELNCVQVELASGQSTISELKARLKLEKKGNNTIHTVHVVITCTSTVLPILHCTTTVHVLYIFNIIVFLHSAYQCRNITASCTCTCTFIIISYGRNET